MVVRVWAPVASVSEQRSWVEWRREVVWFREPMVSMSLAPKGSKGSELFCCWVWEPKSSDRSRRTDCLLM